MIITVTPDQLSKILKHPELHNHQNLNYTPEILKSVGIELPKSFKGTIEIVVRYEDDKIAFPRDER